MSRSALVAILQSRGFYGYSWLTRFALAERVAVTDPNFVPLDGIHEHLQEQAQRYTLPATSNARDLSNHHAERAEFFLELGSNHMEDSEILMALEDYGVDTENSSDVAELRRNLARLDAGITSANTTILTTATDGNLDIMAYIRARERHASMPRPWLELIASARGIDEIPIGSHRRLMPDEELLHLIGMDATRSSEGFRRAKHKSIEELADEHGPLHIAVRAARERYQQDPSLLQIEHQTPFAARKPATTQSTSASNQASQIGAPNKPLFDDLVQQYSVLSRQDMENIASSRNIENVPSLDDRRLVRELAESHDRFQIVTASQPPSITSSTDQQAVDYYLHINRPDLLAMAREAGIHHPSGMSTKDLAEGLARRRPIPPLEVQASAGMTLDTSTDAAKADQLKQIASTWNVKKRKELETELKKRTGSARGGRYTASNSDLANLLAELEYHALTYPLPDGLQSARTEQQVTQFYQKQTIEDLVKARIDLKLSAPTLKDLGPAARAQNQRMYRDSLIRYRWLQIQARAPGRLNQARQRYSAIDDHQMDIIARARGCSTTIKTRDQRITALVRSLAAQDMTLESNPSETKMTPLQQRAREYLLPFATFEQVLHELFRRLEEQGYPIFKTSREDLQSSRTDLRFNGFNVIMQQPERDMASRLAIHEPNQASTIAHQHSRAAQYLAYADLYLDADFTVRRPDLPPEAQQYMELSYVELEEIAKRHGLFFYGGSNPKHVLALLLGQRIPDIMANDPVSPEDRALRDQWMSAPRQELLRRLSTYGVAFSDVNGLGTGQTKYALANMMIRLHHMQQQQREESLQGLSLPQQHTYNAARERWERNNVDVVNEAYIRGHIEGDAIDYLARWEVFATATDRRLLELSFDDLNVIVRALGYTGPSMPSGGSRRVIATRSLYLRWLHSFAASTRDQYVHRLTTDRSGLLREGSAHLQRDSVEITAIRSYPRYSYTDLYHMATEFQRGLEARLGETIDPIVGRDYYWMTPQELGDALRQYGVPVSRRESLPPTTMINWLQIVDARNGIIPALSPHDSFKYSRMTVTGLIAHLRSVGVNVDTSNPPARSALLMLCIDSDPTGFEELSDEDSIIMARLLAHDFARSVTFEQLHRVTNNRDSQGERFRDTIAPQEGSRLAATHTRTLVGPMHVLQQFQRWAIDRDAAPVPTSDSGFQCGARSLALSLEPILASLPGNQAGAAITSDDILSLLFRDYDASVSNDPSVIPDANAHGTPTVEYAALLQERLEGLRDGAEDTLYSQEYGEMTRANNLSTDQLAAALELLFRTGRIPQRFALGILTGKWCLCHQSSETSADIGLDMHELIDNTSGEALSVPASLQVLGETQDDTPVVWLRNVLSDTPGMPNHYEGMNATGSRNIAMRWGVHYASDRHLALRDLQTVRGRQIHRERERDEDMARRSKRRRQKRERKEREALASACEPCREARLTDCDGRKPNACKNCTDSTIPCTWSSHEEEIGDLRQASTITPAEILLWETEMWAEEGWQERTRLLQVAEPDPEPTSPHYLVVAAARLSSQDADQARLNMLIQTLPSVLHRYDQMLLHGAHQNLPEGVRPAPIQRGFILPFVRQGTRAVPTRMGNNMVDPFLMAWCRLIADVTRPNNPQRPTEMHVLTLGLPGFSVDITNWGDYTQGFFRFLLDADQVNGDNHFRDHTYVVPVIEPRLALGVDPQTIAPGQQISWVGHRGKFLKKFLLRDLIDRDRVRRDWAQNNMLMFLAGGRAPQANAYEHDIDEYLDALELEWSWRANQLSMYTNPTDVFMANRNRGRNNPWR